jgi:hypothetical protein
MFRDGVARFRGRNAFRASAITRRARLTAASRLITDFAFGIGDF